MQEPLTTHSQRAVRPCIGHRAEARVHGTDTASGGHCPHACPAAKWEAIWDNDAADMKKCVDQARPIMLKEDL